MKAFVIILAMFGSLYAAPTFYKPLLNIAFFVAGIGISWSYLLTAGVLVAGLKLKAGK